MAIISIHQFILHVIMTQVVASHPHCQTNSTQLTRTGSESFYRIDGSDAPTVIDKIQAKRLYHLQRAPNVNTRLHLDSLDTSFDSPRDFDNSARQQVNRKSVQPIRTIYHRPTGMSDQSIYSSASTLFRSQEEFNNEFRPCLTDRSVSNKTVHSQPTPRDTFNVDEGYKQVEYSFQDQNYVSSQLDLTCYNSGKQQGEKLPQQTVFDSASWSPRLTSTLPLPSTTTTTCKTNGPDPLLKSQSHSSLYDKRTCDILKWDRAQPRHVQFFRKPIGNVAPLPRAQQISGYSGTIGASNPQDIDNPTVDFQPYTVLRTQQPKYTIRSSKANITTYAGNTHWTKTDPVSHYDLSGDAYTTTAATYRSLPIDNSLYRHGNLHGEFSKSVTNVMPYNPYNRMENRKETTNGSLDSRPHLILRQLPRIKLPPAVRPAKKEEPAVDNEIKT